MLRKLASVAREETAALQPRVLLVRALTALLPKYTATRGRTWIFRACGFRVGRRTVICGTPAIYGAPDLVKLLTIGDGVFINVGCHFDVHAPVNIGRNAVLGHDVMILTATHELGPPQERCGPLVFAPVSIGAGAWLGARSLVLPSVTVGDGAVVAAGAVVTRDVPANTLVAGVPARVVGTPESGRSPAAFRSPA